MRIFRHYENFPDDLKGAAIAVGNFDGVHLGHCGVIGEASRIARAADIPWGVMTFEPHPRAYFTPNQDAFRLSPFRIKCRQMRIMGVEYLFVQRFNAAFSSQSADEFVDRFFATSGHDLSELRSRLRTARVLEARIELATLALARYRLRTRDVADLLEKNRSTVTRWLNAGLQRERDDGDFGLRLDTLDQAISNRKTDNAPMRYVAP